MEQMGEDKKRLAELSAEGERLLSHLSKAWAGGVQERLASCQLALDGFVVACRQRLHSLEESASLQGG